jgi:hypothetical protein
VNLDQWIGLIFLLVAAGLYFASDFLLAPVFLAFGGMMEFSKSRRLVHVGIALALGGPVLIAVTFLLGWLCACAGLWWSARFFGGACLLIFTGWVVGGIVVGRAKARLAANEQDPIGKTELRE